MDSAAKKLFWDRAAKTILLTIASYIGFRLFPIILEDPAITFRVARNFALGNGLIYNSGELYQASSAPGYALFLGLVGRLIPASINYFSQIANVLSAAALFSISLTIYDFGVRRNLRLLGFIAALLSVTLTAVWQAYNNEILPQVALVLLGFSFIDRDKPIGAAALFACATVVRPDAILAVAPALVAYLVKRSPAAEESPRRYEKYRQAWIAAGVFAVIVGPLAAWSWSYYGFLLPQTMQAKIAQVEGRYNPGFYPGMNQWLMDHVFYGKSAYLYFQVAAFGLILLCNNRRWRPFLPIVAWGGIHYAFYTLKNVAFYYWYLPPIGIAAAILLAAIAGQTYTWARDATSMKRILLIGAAVTALKLGKDAVDIGWLYGTSFPTPYVAILGAGLLIILGLVLREVVRLWRVRRQLWGWVVAPAPSSLRLAGVIPLAVVWGWIGWLMSNHLEKTNGLVAWATGTHLELYRKTASWIRSNIRSGTTVGYLEIGTLGWNLPEYRILDPLGLGSPGMVEFVRKHDEYAGAYSTQRPEIILGHPLLTPDLLKKDVPKGWQQWFRSNYRLIHTVWLSEYEKVQIFADAKRSASAIFRPSNSGYVADLRITSKG